MLLVSAVLLGTSTFAWFSMNKTVTATGMKVIATAEGSLIIKDSAPAANDSSVTHDFNDGSATALVPSRHVDGTTSDFTSHDAVTIVATSGLVYNNNAAEVDANTGLKHGATDLTFAAAANGDKTYYVDKTVYIAASGMAMEDQKLTVTISSPTGVTNLNAATSIDFYYTTDGTAPTPSTTTFAGTLNLAGLDAATNDASTAKTQVIINDNGSGIAIPLANGSAGIVVLMRIYIDGGLLKEANRAATGTYVAGTKYYTSIACTDEVDTTGFVAGSTDVSSYFLHGSTYVKTVSAAEIASQTLTVQFVASSNA